MFIMQMFANNIVKINRNHAMEIWGKLNQSQYNRLPSGWNLMGLKFISLNKCDDPTSLDRQLRFEIIDKNKFTWLVMQHDIRYEI